MCASCRKTRKREKKESKCRLRFGDVVVQSAQCSAGPLEPIPASGGGMGVIDSGDRHVRVAGVGCTLF